MQPPLLTFVSCTVGGGPGPLCATVCHVCEGENLLMGCLSFSTSPFISPLKEEA